jgi:ABC-2 type transport system ATP-binding protein
MIEVKNLSKSFEYHKKAEGLSGSIKAMFKREILIKHAVRDISFNIDQGEIVGFIGPNGAGKTTTLKMLSGILQPTAGSISVMGFNPTKRQDEFKKNFSLVLGQKPQLWVTLPAIESFNLIRKIYEVPDEIYKKNLETLTELLDIKDLLNIQVRKLSLGQKMKCEMVAALLHDPKIIFLDEPTIGLDVISQKKIREFLKDYNRRTKATIILTSHYMDDVEDLCERLIIINEGQVGYDGSLNNLLNTYSKDKIIKLDLSKKTSKKEIEVFGKIISYSPYEVVLSIPVDEVNKKIGKLVSKLPIKDMSINSVTLEEVVSDIFSKAV